MLFYIEMIEPPIPIERIYASHYENSLDLYRTINLDGIIIACNSTYAESLGYSKDEVIGKSIFDHISQKSFNTLKESFETWKDTGIVRNVKIFMERKDGTQFPVLLNVSNLYDSKGNVIGSNTVLRDISDLHKTKKTVDNLKEKRLEEIGQLSSRIAHDIRNPLTTINTVLTLMKMSDFSNDKRYIKYLETLTRQQKKLVRLTSEMIDFVQPKPIKLEKTSILKIIHNTINEIDIPKEIQIEIPTNDATLLCDSFKIETVFSNLVSNAVQVLGSSGKISITIQKTHNCIIIRIQDNGPGIPEDKLGKIFDPFFTTRETGTGLGLLSCKHIIEQHGGSIDVETKETKGTAFIINLPCLEK